mmetsp:Transcript_144988/g.255572  ORF Transcript_144988/g.255572 Transcript_144988/m.255572 type:complete len:143 (-) Transcript_144988:50-478(-)
MVGAQPMPQPIVMELWMSDWSKSLYVRASQGVSSKSWLLFLRSSVRALKCTVRQSVSCSPSFTQDLAEVDCHTLPFSQVREAVWAETWSVHKQQPHHEVMYVAAVDRLGIGVNSAHGGSDPSKATLYILLEMYRSQESFSYS